MPLGAGNVEPHVSYPPPGLLGLVQRVGGGSSTARAKAVHLLKAKAWTQHGHLPRAIAQSKSQSLCKFKRLRNKLHFLMKTATKDCDHFYNPPHIEWHRTSFLSPFRSIKGVGATAPTPSLARAQARPFPELGVQTWQEGAREVAASLSSMLPYPGP